MAVPGFQAGHATQSSRPIDCLHNICANRWPFTIQHSPGIGLIKKDPRFLYLWQTPCIMNEQVEPSVQSHPPEVLLSVVDADSIIKFSMVKVRRR